MSWWRIGESHGHRRGVHVEYDIANNIAMRVLPPQRLRSLDMRPLPSTSIAEVRRVPIHLSFVCYATNTEQHEDEDKQVEAVSAAMNDSEE